jgi:hypothetical protein
MLVINTNTTPTTSRRCVTELEAAWLAKALVCASVSFYCEPEPEGYYLFHVNVEAGHVIDKIMKAGGL